MTGGAAPLFTVVMPAFNAVHTIAASLDSARRQTVRAIEIVVVDDGSTDETATTVMAIARADDRIRLLRQANAGPMAARNHGIAASRAPYIASLDADDLWHPAYLAAMREAMEPVEGPAPGFAYALHHVIDADDRIIATPATPHIQGHAFNRHLLVNMVGNGSGAVFRRDALVAAGGYDPQTRAWGGAEDYLLQLRIAARWPIACVPRRLVGYRRVANSFSDDPLKMARARIRAVDLALEEKGCTFSIRRRVMADALRTAAALLMLRGQWRAALWPAIHAVWTDPLAAADDALRRAINGVSRRSAPPTRIFGDGVPPVEPSARLPPRQAARLRRLATLDLADCTAGIALKPAKEYGPEIAHPWPIQHDR